MASAAPAASSVPTRRWSSSSTSSACAESGGRRGLLAPRRAGHLGRRGLDEVRQEAPGVRVRDASDLLGRARGDHAAALLAALRPHVDEAVGGLDDVEVVLDDHDRVALVDEAVQHLEQALDVGEVQAGRRLVEDVQRRAGRDLGQLGGQLDALRLAARQRRRRLAEADVAEPDVVERLQAAADLRDVLEELDGLLDGHVEDVGDRLALEADVERLAVVALAAALLARHVDVGQEVHLDLDLPVAAADLAAAALDVEREAAGLEAAHPRLLRLGEQVADDVEQAGVGRGVRARRAADRRLVDLDDLVELLDALQPAVRAGPEPRPHQSRRAGLVEDLVDQRRFPGARYAGHTRQHAQRDLDVDRLQVVLG